MSEHRPEVADVFRTYEKDFFALWGRVLSPQQRKAFKGIRDCRTAALGRHAEYAEQCDTCFRRSATHHPTPEIDSIPIGLVPAHFNPILSAMFPASPFAACPRLSPKSTAPKPLPIESL